MKILHTSDWHVGKQIRGRSRAGEHVAVLNEIAQIAKQQKVDLILVAGDLFETAAPTAESERIVYQAFLSFADVAPVAVISGNHDNARRLRAIAPLLELGKIQLVTEPKSPKDGGVIEIKTGSGEICNIAMLPFISQRSIVKAKTLMTNEAFQNSQTYSHRLQQIVEVMCSGFNENAVNLVMAHAFVSGAVAGGGERAAHLADEYSISSLAFPVTASYVALGHLHRPQKIQGQTAIYYSGSPLQLDFGEVEQKKSVNIVNASPGLPAKVETVQLESGNKLVTLAGSLESIKVQAKELPDTAWVRVKLDEPFRLGLAEEVKDLLGDSVVDIKIESTITPKQHKVRKKDNRSHAELFVDYLNENSAFDQEISKAFNSLYEETYQLEQDQASIDISKTETLQTTFGLFEGAQSE